jgi:hypothetical protein
MKSCERTAVEAEDISLVIYMAKSVFEAVMPDHIGAAITADHLGALVPVGDRPFGVDEVDAVPDAVENPAEETFACILWKSGRFPR